MASSEPAKPIHVAIIGGGIGGLCFAIGLAKHNISYHIYEAAHHFAEIGAGVAFGPNARRAMSLIDPRIKEGYDRRATYNQEESQDVYFHFQMGMDGRDKTKGRKAGDPIVDVGGPGLGLSMVHRAQFLDELVKLVPPENVTFNKKFVEFEDNGSSGIRLHFQDSTHADADIAIGCDGIKSTMRLKLLGPQSSATFTGKYAYRGLIPMPKAISLLGEKLALNGQAHLGYGGHVLTMPVEMGDLMNVVAFQTKADGKWENEQWVLPMKHEDLDADFKDWGPPVKSILSLMEKPDVWALFEHPPAPNYHRGRVGLLGDAAHASTPHQGAGAGMAVEDAYILSALLSRVENAELDLEAMFVAYDEVRRPRTQRLVDTSGKTAKVYELQGERTEDDLEAIAEELKGRWEWIWKVDLERELDMAREVFERRRKGTEK